MTDAQKPPHSSCDGKTPTLRVPSVLLILFGAFSKLKIKEVCGLGQLTENGVVANFDEGMLLANFRMRVRTFTMICNCVRPLLARQDTHLWPSAPVEKKDCEYGGLLWAQVTEPLYIFLGLGRAWFASLCTKFAGL